MANDVQKCDWARRNGVAQSGTGLKKCEARLCAKRLPQQFEFCARFPTSEVLRLSLRPQPHSDRVMDVPEWVGPMHSLRP
jgi:hypothetical protein